MIYLVYRPYVGLKLVFMMYIVCAYTTDYDLLVLPVREMIPLYHRQYLNSYSSCVSLFMCTLYINSLFHLIGEKENSNQSHWSVGHLWV